MSASSAERTPEEQGVEPLAAVSALVEADLIPDKRLDEAQTDRFRYDALAVGLADLVTAVRPPINIALYGAWGAGKSSLGWLLHQELLRRNPVKGHRTIGYIHYDAWRHGGQALRRNFISNAAEKLGLDERRYPCRRRVKTDPPPPVEN